MQPNFLRSVAQYYSSEAPGRPAQENIIYVLPNKRSAMFLKKYVREQVSGVALMPRFMTMRTFISIFAARPEAQPRELLFILYEAYRRAMKARGRAEGVREFDSFIFWGDMILSDFDDIDRSLVNADELFKNLRDIKEIQANYLDDEQKEVIRRVWGESRLTADIDEFWLHIGENPEDGAMASKFVYLWEILAEVYHNFHSILAEKGIASPGGQYRSALAKISCLNDYDIPADTHYVFVGFNDLSTVETLIFDRLRGLGVASFFWDTAVLSAGADIQFSRPLRRLSELVRNFPMPAGYSVPMPECTPEITVSAVPSNVGQAKALTPLLSDWAQAGYIDSANPLNTAVVLPDQGLLLPSLMSIPEDITAVNISMGLSYRTTTFASLLHSIISMQLRARDIHGSTHFYYEDLTSVLAHPHIQLIARVEADDLSKMIAENKLYNIAAAEVTAMAPSLKAVFTPVRDLSQVADVAAYLLKLLDWLQARLDTSDPDSEMPVAKFELEAIAYFRSEVEALSELIAQYGVTMTERTFFHLFERIFTSRGLTVNGTPLAGLQVLGVLETRALDFDNLIVLSMNERVFPRKQYSRTMIPNTLRSGFGLPDFESLELTYAYCFYRLIARARRVSLFYDSRTDGLGNGEVSRYISQMKYLMPGLNVKVGTVSYPAGSDSKASISLPKTPEIMAELDEFRAGGRLRLSASALKTYKQCPMKFYLEYARRMRGSDELVDYISASEFGTVVHNVIQKLYSDYKGQLITSEVLDKWLHPDNARIDEIAREMIVRERYPKAKNPDEVILSAEAQLASSLVAKIARANLVAERDLYCRGGQSFTFVENEMKVNKVWSVAPDLDVNFYMSIDRVDQVSGEFLRFIDFKTGDDDFVSEKLDSLFNRNSTAKDGILQLMIYCEAYLSIENEAVDIEAVLHPMRRLSGGFPLMPLRIAGQDMTSYKALRDEFKPLLQTFIKEIFDPAVPITQCKSDTPCVYCPFQAMCGRIPKRY